ncbi:IPT/TIG domain-containing protein [Actinoplanes sp. NPDC023714]|uniref:IPT/TIG domain-containing protein n=1 Tax=Actinoplanes sp. NPDC023714 TaxID=3154322 RepID=UPI0033DEF840
MSVLLRGAAAVAVGALVLAGGAGAASAAPGPAAPGRAASGQALVMAGRPTVSGITPSRVSTAGGSTVTITGKNFTEVSAITFGGADATSYTVASSTKITAVVPAGTSGAAPLVITTPEGESLVTKTTVVNYRTPLGVDTSGNPVAKAGGGPLVLTITGGTLGATSKDFAKELVSVVFNKTKTTATYVDETHLKINVPAGTAESATVTVVHDQIAGEPATITLVPVVTGLSVKYSTLTGGVKTVVKVAGAAIGDAKDFTFGENPADCVKQGATSNPTFLCLVPPATTAGPVAVSFTSGSGTRSRFTAAAIFSYTDN